MTPSGWITLLACGGELVLLILVLLRGTRTPMAGPLIGLSVVIFGWNFASLAYAASGMDEWRWLDVTFSPLTSAFALHFVLGVTGRRKQLRHVRLLSYVCFGALSALGPLSFFSEPIRGFYTSGAWAAVHLVGAVLAVSLSIVLLALHVRGSHDPAERARTRLLLGALAAALVLGSTELIADLGFALPRLGALGVLVGNALVVLVSLRLRVFDRALSAIDMLFAVVLAALGVGAYLAVFEMLATDNALVVVAAVTLTLVLLAGLRQLVLGMRSEREQLEHFAHLGRLSAQLAHDLKNPLAALRGAAQFLDVEVAQARSITPHREFLALIVDQADRMQRVVDEYQRLGRMELSRKRVDPNELVRDTLKLQSFAAGEQVEVKEALAAPLPPVEADVDLVCNALHNLLRNAFQAMPSGGTVTVESRSDESGDEAFVVLAVSDTGVGMDPRTRERALEEYFTTREGGTGLGLAFVRRVATAHGGRVVLQSREGQGTRVELWLPSA